MILGILGKWSQKAHHVYWSLFDFPLKNVLLLRSKPLTHTHTYTHTRWSDTLTNGCTKNTPEFCSLFPLPWSTGSPAAFESDHIEHGRHLHRHTRTRTISMYVSSHINDCLRLWVDHKRPSSAEGDYQTVFHAKCISRETLRNKKISLVNGFWRRIFVIRKWGREKSKLTLNTWMTSNKNDWQLS